ncbi:MAG: porin family protein [Candidatus Zixiibacteriota bacterium]|nr:MAG: porin family protein [candidate division Zixibacteria bacterium]
MTTVKLLITASMVMLIFVAATSAQSLENRHQIGLRLGMWNMVTDVRTSVNTDGVSTSVGSNGFIGGVGYNYWLKENVALDISVGGMMTDVDTDIDFTGVSTSTATIGQLLFGVKYYLPVSTSATSVRPYAMLGVGPYIGEQTETKIGTTVAVESASEYALGGKLAAGVDFPLSRHFMVGVAAGYNFMNDFDQPIGGSDNYSGPEFLIGFGYLFGSGVN